MNYTKLAMMILASTVAFSADRFDTQVRNKFFHGFAGDKGALEEGMKACESVLSENPKHAEARVWYGAGQFFRSGPLFRAGDKEKGMEAWTSGMRNMDEAVELEPDNAGVRVPRGAVMLNASRFTPPEMGKPLLERGLNDYEHVLKLQERTFHELGTHPRGELLFGLAEGWSRTGDNEKAKMYFERIAKDLPGSPYALRAATWLETKSLPLEQTGCIGCHTRK